MWFTAHWPALLDAAEHARQSVASPGTAKFGFFSADQAAEIDAMCSRIIPTTDTPGAHEAGVVYFIDRALTTFAKTQQKTFTRGLPPLQSRVHELFIGVDKFSSCGPGQQDQVLQSIDTRYPGPKPYDLPRRPAAEALFEAVYTGAISGFLIDPDSGRLGNRNGAGWIAIGREPSHMFQPPFGYYDKNYPGWQATPAEAGKSPHES